MVNLSEKYQKFIILTEPNCEKQKDQNAAFLEARKFLVDEHTTFFVEHPEMLYTLTKSPGRKNRMDQLIPGYSRGIVEFKDCNFYFSFEFK